MWMSRRTLALRLTEGETQTHVDKWDPQNDQNQQLVQDQLDDAQFKD